MSPRRTLLLAMAALLCLAGTPTLSSSAEIPPLEQRAAWFRQDRFGLFIHWGIYSLIGQGEWIQDTGKIPVTEYEQLVPKFNPSEFNAAEWVAAARQAGQKYIVITAKHHDGFCLFDSKLTDYDVMSSPFRRDVIRELTDECHKQGLRIGYYYSIMDWHHPDYLPRRKWEAATRPVAEADFNRYLEYMQGQIRELMSNYGRVDLLWFDGGWEHQSLEDREKFADIIRIARELQPQLLVNDRAHIGGDFQTPEQYIPATGLLGADGQPALWEACLTMTTGHGSYSPTAWWGYDKNEKAFKPTEELIQKLVDVCSKGGNLLLNVGPMPSGRIQPEMTERLQGIGSWMDQHSEAIYGTTASPFRRYPFFGRVTTKGDVLNVVLFDWPENQKLLLPGLKTAVTDCRFLAKAGPTGEKLPVQVSEAGVSISLPDMPPDPVASVLVVKLAEPPEVVPSTIHPDAQGVVRLNALLADIRAQHGQRARPMSRAGRGYIGDWSNPNDRVIWEFHLAAAGSYRVELEGTAASPEASGQRVEVTVGDQKLIGKIVPEGVKLEGKLQLPTGDLVLSVKLLDAKRTGGPVLDLYEVRLIPVK